MEDKIVIRIEIEIVDEKSKLMVYELEKTEDVTYETASMYKGFHNYKGEEKRRRIYKREMHYPITYCKAGELVTLKDQVVCFMDTHKDDKNRGIEKLIEFFEGMIMAEFNVATHYLDEYRELKI